MEPLNMSDICNKNEYNLILRWNIFFLLIDFNYELKKLQIFLSISLKELKVSKFSLLILLKYA